MGHAVELQVGVYMALGKGSLLGMEIAEGVLQGVLGRLLRGVRGLRRDRFRRGGPRRLRGSRLPSAAGGEEQEQGQGEDEA